MYRILRVSNRKDGILVCDILCYSKQVFEMFWKQFKKNKSLNVQEVVKSSGLEEVKK